MTALADFQTYATFAEVEAALAEGLISEAEAYAAAAWPPTEAEGVGFGAGSPVLHDRTTELDLVRP